MQRRVSWIAQAALLLAILLVVQLVAFTIPKSVPIVSQLFTGTLVNLVLIVGSATVGLAGTAVAAFLSPMLAFVLGQMKFVHMILPVGIGNLLIVVITWMFFRRRDALKQPVIMDSLGILLGAIVKWLFLWVFTVLIIVPMFFLETPAANALSTMFSWPQLITALLGGVIAVLVLPAIRNYRKKQRIK
jgi:hypothetical protein